MAGKRRGTGRPLRSVEKAERRKAAVLDRLGDATSPSHRLAIALDYLRSALALVPTHVAEQVALVVVNDLVKEADQLYAPGTVTKLERKAS
ncbi:hypothetical protein [Kribbella catacumbae]|uniref:hypothetical protein n=1 Tax=Kribbella catacumbae TaxID=460086 RepID=UPI00037FE099|nr:hypothetical protein [Kribbella catacumbae]